MKYLVVSGGVISGVGKGIVASSAGLLIQSKALSVTCIKIDPYINIDAATTSPREHGEIYVTDDGGQVNMDLGNYERYLSITLGQDHHITTGKVYQQVINAERVGEYLGKTVQVVPHVTDAISAWIERVARVAVNDSATEPAVCIIELGGTIGDIESSPFIYALAQLRKKVGKQNFVHVHVSYVPVAIPGTVSEQKTKPTQRALRDIRGAGLDPELIVCRSKTPLSPALIQKLSNMCSVGPEQVFGVHDVSTTYHVPILLERQGFLRAISKYLDLPSAASPQGTAMWKQWVDLVQSSETARETIPIALVGEYVSRKDAYLSITKALEHAAMFCHKKVEIIWVDANDLDPAKMFTSPDKWHKSWYDLLSAEGVIMPGGPETHPGMGMVKAINWARENNIPFLGIGLGMHLAFSEFMHFNEPARPGSENFENFSEWQYNLHNFVYPQPDVDNLTATSEMLLGKHEFQFHPDIGWSKVRALYGTSVSSTQERHRHTNFVHQHSVEVVADWGFPCIAVDSVSRRMAILELRSHPWFVGVQFNPEYLSRVLQPSKTILGFFAAAAECLEDVTEALAQGRSSL
ncbi:unnamed protein product [Penicillium salamii]|uniref:CTP synthase n=1 Tax=Penicillium salamii TaxID=1612424 RepID=A0A9W4NMX2_9EURO|nr:unnamed protein product [Penicillium salamii]CAG8061866.1 unnamed protein product [Penicillium salamii]CAG8140418.1 unnamed protein product [Penicillium salamii]CAG8149863.1 unnamed protein product [Penicillium salamii]CAG8157990.1 unnamed protein product [Penicillium salamii]